MAIVLDASLTLAWLLNEDIPRTHDAVLDALVDADVLVPSIWPAEVANGIRYAEVRGRISADDIAAFAAHLSALPVTVDETSLTKVFASVLDLAREYDLTVYDASYLELAMREGTPLAVLDPDLLRAAPLAGVELLGRG